MALLPLCDHGRAEEEVVTYAAAQITAQVSDHGAACQSVASLGFFGKLAYPQLNAFDLIGRESMRESPFYQDIVEEGQLEAYRNSTSDVLTIRFGSAARSSRTR